MDETAYGPGAKTLILLYSFPLFVCENLNIRAYNDSFLQFPMSCVVRKPAFSICENKGADQLRSSHAADQRLCFRLTDSTSSLLPKYEFLSINPYSVSVWTDLCRTVSETPKTNFLMTRLISDNILSFYDNAFWQL